MNNVIYISRVCSQDTFSGLMKKRTGALHQPAQKFHDILVRGLHENGMKVKCISSLPLYNQKIFENQTKEIDNGIEYYYAPSTKYKIKPLLYMIYVFFKVVSLLRKEKESVVICDILDVSIGFGALFASKICKKKFVGLVTDLPDDLVKQKNLFSMLSNYLIAKSDAYIFLSEFMNQKINKSNKNYVIVEGVVDKTIIPEKKEIIDEEVKKCMYAGALAEKYGVKKLVDAFVSMNNENYILDIYGYGELENYIEEIANQYTNINYYGLVSNQEIVEIEKKMDILINPRPSDEMFTLYSFPSKNMEYLSSGTAMLCTRLKCIPQEYHKYMYFIDDESEQGFVDAIQKHMSKSKKELCEFGYVAQKWVINNKNRIIQTKKIITMLEKREDKDGN